MEQTNVRKTVVAKNVGGTSVVDEQVTTGEATDPGEFSIAKANQVVWYLAHFIAIVLFLRFTFLILGANLRGVVLFVYNVSNVFVLPFRGIFPSPQSGVSYMDTAALLGIAMYYLLAFLITQAFTLLSKRIEA
jgi:hypothetical protein